MRAATTIRTGPVHRAKRRPPGRLDSHKKWTDRGGLVNGSTLGRPEPNGSDGWSPIHRPATRELLLDLKAQGYTVINLVAGGTAVPFRDVPITVMI
jgi:hypothetical protein